MEKYATILVFMESEKLDSHFEYNFSTIAERSPPEIEKGVFASK